MRRVLLVLGVLVFTVSAFAQMAPAPAGPPQLTWLRFYTVDRSHTRNFMDVFNRTTGPVLDRLASDRQVAGWGLAVPFTMTGEDWTHMLWITVNNWAAGDAVVRALEESDRSRPAADMEHDQMMMADAIGNVRDVVLRHVEQSPAPPPPSFRPMYIRVGYYTVNPGREADAAGLFHDYTVPLFRDLAARGVIGPFGMSTQEVVTDPSFTHVIWTFVDSLARFDQVREASMARPADAQKNANAKINDMTDADNFHSEILRIVKMNSMMPAR